MREDIKFLYKCIYRTFHGNDIDFEELEAVLAKYGYALDEECDLIDKGE